MKFLQLHEIKCSKTQAAYEISGAKDGPKEVKRAPTNIIEKGCSVYKT